MHMEIYKSILYYFISYIDKIEDEKEKSQFQFLDDECCCYIGEYSDETIHKGRIPNNTRYLCIGNRYNQVFKKDIFPENLHTICIGHKYNKEIGKNILNRHLKELIFGAGFNKQFMRDVLPHGLIRLELGNDYNKKINKNILPKTLRYLKLGHFFNFSIEKDVLPESLEELEIGGCYQHPIYPDVLPYNLRKLKMFSFVNQLEIPGIFPNSLREMILYNRGYEQNFIEGMIPEGVETLEIHRLKHRSNRYRNIIPTTVKKLKLIDYYGVFRSGFVHEGLEKLCIQNYEQKNMAKYSQHANRFQLKIESIPKSVIYFRLYVDKVEWIGNPDLSHLVYISLYNNKINISKKDLHCFIRRDSKNLSMKQIVLPDKMNNKILKSKVFLQHSFMDHHYPLENFLEWKIDEWKEIVKHKMMCIHELKERINFPFIYVF